VSVVNRSEGCSCDGGLRGTFGTTCGMVRLRGVPGILSFSEVVCTERQESSALQEQLIWGGAGRARIQRARQIGGAVWLIRW